MSEPQQQEAIRIGEDGEPIYADWDNPESLTEALEVADTPAAPAPSRAQQEANEWAKANRDKIEARLKELTLSKKRLDALLKMPDSALMAGVERWYSAAETARFFGRTNQWIYDRIANKKFVYTDGTAIEPVLMEGNMRFTTELIREIALSMYRRGTVKRPELILILRRVQQAELGEVVLEDE